MAVRKNVAVFDERRNTSRVFQPDPGALGAAQRALADHAHKYPKHARWIAEGHPSIGTDEQHHAHFDVAYKHGELT